MPYTSLYIHVPFCIHRCEYCDFNTYAGLQGLIPEYAQAVRKEIEYLAQTATEPVSIYTIYFGGGTPSLMPAGEIDLILAHVQQYYDCAPFLEITLEANPGTVSKEYFTRLHDIGVNRISLGMQSANQAELTLLGRQHTFFDVVKAVEWLRAAGINNLNLDLIYGLPNQDTKTWMTSVDRAISLKPEHLSLYALSLEHGTPMKHKVDMGILPAPDADQAADMYEAASERLFQAGYFQYEISNWARKNRSGELRWCLHNMQYWRTLPYIGIGAGAHGFTNHYRTVNIASPRAYIKRIKNSTECKNKDGYPHTPATIRRHFISCETEIGEMMMMGLRLVVQGVSNREFQDRYSISLQEKFSPQIDRLLSLGLLEWDRSQEEILRLTPGGRLLGNQVFKEFI